MGVLQVRIYIIDHIKLTSWATWIIQELIFTGNQTMFNKPTEAIMLSLINIIIFDPQNKIKLPAHDTFNNILKVSIIISI